MQRVVVEVGLGAGAPMIASRRLLKDRAFDVIKELIQEETLPPGSFLSERQLSAWLGMSTTPIRSALNRLEEQGFIAVSPQQGAVVREASFREIVDVYDVRIALETFVARSLAGRLAADQAERLRENLAAQDAAVVARDVARFTHLDTAFHVMLSEFLDNREIVRVMAHLRDKLHRFAARVLRHSMNRLQSSWEEHAAVTEAVLAGDGELAARRAGEHLEFGKRFLISS